MLRRLSRGCLSATISSVFPSITTAASSSETLPASPPRFEATSAGIVDQNVAHRLRHRSSYSRRNQESSHNAPHLLFLLLVVLFLRYHRYRIEFLARKLRIHPGQVLPDDRL